MPTVAVISCDPVSSLICEIAKTEGLDCGFYFPSKRLDPSLNRARTVVLGPQESSGEVFSKILSLRVDLRFRGSIIIISFRKAPILREGDTWDKVEHLGCFHLQIPFFVDEFVELVLRPRALSEVELTSARKKLGARRIVQQTRVLRHDYENKFGLALAYLRELEKLSYFKEFDRGRISKAIAQVALHLTRYKLERFCTDLTTLREDVEMWSPGKHPSLEWAGKDVEGLLELFEAADSVSRFGQKEFFNRARLAKEKIKSTLAAVTELRDEALRAIEHDEQNSFPR